MFPVSFASLWRKWAKITGSSGAITLAVALMIGAAAQAEPIRGAGSTLAAPIIGKWAAAYESARADGGDYVSPDWKVDYEIVGSLAGVLRLDQPDMDFAATDAPVNAAD
ncbi:MAG: phosphate ABC transporter substrate-binding protein PstS, partial [Mesorhizobium sp.]